MADKITLHIKNLKDIKKFFDTAKAKVDDSLAFMRMSAVFYLREIFLVFRKQGAHSGRRRWKKYSIKTLHPAVRVKGKVVRYNRNKWNIRYGTDMRETSPPRPPGAKVRRYGSGSQMFQASGQFKGSYRVLRVTKKVATIGTKHELAKKIMRKKTSPFHRPVITPITAMQRAHFRRTLRAWAKGAFE